MQAVSRGAWLLAGAFKEALGRPELTGHDFAGSHSLQSSLVLERVLQY
jgi:hypothetical protein